jgi:hypothetical protein
MILGVDNSNDGAEGESGMRCGLRVHVISLTIGGELSIKVFSIPTGSAFPNRQRLRAAMIGS